MFSFFCVFLFIPKKDREKYLARSSGKLPLRNNHFSLFSLRFIEQYPYRDCDISKVLLHLIHITVNTLNAQYHSCKPHAAAGPLYSDNSNVSRYSGKSKGRKRRGEKQPGRTRCVQRLFEGR